MSLTRTLKRFTTAALLIAAATPALAHEGEHNNLSAEVTLDVVSQYFFRGYEQQDSGLIFQPGVTIGFEASDTVDAYIGVWESFHSVPTVGAPTNPRGWYEQDVFAGVTFSLNDYISVDVGYYGYFSPSDSFSDIHELDLKIQFEDEQFVGEAWSFDPYILIAWEVQDNGGTEDTYAEIGGAFSFDMADIYDLPIEWSVPFAVGLSLDDYYVDSTGDNEVFGYASVGLMATIPLSEIIDSDWVGGWSMTGGVTVLFLNDNAALTDNISGSSDEFQIIGSLGFAREF